MNKKVFYPFILSMAILIIPLTVMSQTVYVEAEKETVSAGTIIPINVKVKNISDLYGFQFNVRFNNEILSLYTAENSPYNPLYSEGNFLNQDGAETYISVLAKEDRVNKITQIEISGHITTLKNVVNTRLQTPDVPSSIKGVSGEGTLVKIYFKGFKEGESEITLGAAKLVNPNAEIIPVTIESGKVIIIPEYFSNLFFMHLESGLNMISLPLKPVQAYTARSLAEHIGANVVIKLDEKQHRFVGFTTDAPDDGFEIKGGRGYIVNVEGSRTVAFTGAAWTNQLPVEAAPQAVRKSSWAFVVSGLVFSNETMSVRDSDYIVTTRNLRTGATATEVIDSSGYFAAAWADLNRKAVIEAQDRVEITVMNSSGEIVSGPMVSEITLEDVGNALMNVRLKLGDIIPAKSVLLQNYPNPFNPETWIPYQLKHAAPISIKIYSASGQLVRTLNLGHKDAGVYISRSKAAYWNGKNEVGEKVASGIYLYTIQAGEFGATGKMVIMK